MTAVIIQPQFVPIANWTGPNGRPVPVYVTQEWRRPLEQLAQLLNALQAGGTTGGGSTGGTVDLTALAADVEALELAISQQFATRYDQDDADNPTIAYLGNAEPGTAGSAGAWRIQRLTFSSDGDVSVQWADGDANFDNVWDNRASLSYS